MSSTNAGDRATDLDSPAAHDTGLYDPHRHDNQIVALYETNARAHAARDDLIAAGVASSAIRVLDREVAPPGSSGAEVGFWGAIKSLFVPDDEATAYGHAVSGGHAMLVVTPDASTDRGRVIRVLEKSEPVDFDARLEEWRQSGYDYSTAPWAGSGAIGAAEGMASGLASPADPVNDDQPAPRVAAPATNAEPPSPPADTGSVVESRAGQGDGVRVVEERLRTGRREASSGSARVRSYLVDRPADQSVQLREEPFQAGTVASRAAADDATLTVGSGPDSGATQGSPGSGGTTPNATPGATTSGANSRV